MVVKNDTVIAICYCGFQITVPPSTVRVHHIHNEPSLFYVMQLVREGGIKPTGQDDDRKWRGKFKQ